MTKNTRPSKWDITIAPLEQRVEIYRADNNNKNTHIKRKKRLQAIKTNKQFNLDNKKMLARLELAEKSITAREVNNAITATSGVNDTIYCCKTGAIVGKIDTQAITIINQLKMPFDDESGLTTWQSHHAVHPAWLNTSSSVLAQLQRIMPHEYCVYLYTYLIELNTAACHKIITEVAEIATNDDRYMTKATKTTTITSIPATIKHKLLTQLYLSPLAIIIEIAELLRIFAALMGKNNVIVGAMPNLVKLDTINFRDELLSFIREPLQKQQKKIHAEDSQRVNLITMFDLHQITANDGMRAFRDAKITLDDDDPILKDVAELFQEAGLTSTMVAKSYSQVEHLFKHKQKESLYDTKVINSTANKAKTPIKLTPITLWTQAKPKEVIINDETNS